MPVVSPRLVLTLWSERCLHIRSHGFPWLPCFSRILFLRKSFWASPPQYTSADTTHSSSRSRGFFPSCYESHPLLWWPVLVLKSESDPARRIMDTGPQDFARPFKLQRYQRQLDDSTIKHLLGKTAFCLSNETLSEETAVLGFSYGTLVQLDSVPLFSCSTDSCQWWLLWTELILQN